MIAQDHSRQTSKGISDEITAVPQPAGFETLKPSNDAKSYGSVTVHKKMTKEIPWDEREA